MREELTQAELLALAGSACYAAVALSSWPGDYETARRLRQTAQGLVARSGLSPTELKDLGLRLAARVRELTP